MSSSRRATSSVAKCFQMYCQSTLDPSGEVTFCVLYCHESPYVLVKYLQSAWGVTPVLLPDVSQCTVRVPSICLGELHLPSVPVGPDFVCQILRRDLLVFGLSSVDPAPEQVSSSRRATSFVAKCFQYTVKVPSICLGKSLFVSLSSVTILLSSTFL